MSDATPNPKTQVICILGMHRSGTSLISRIINLLGVYLGPEDQLRKAAKDNPLGFWEHRRLTALNDEILSRLGGSWHEPPVFRPGWEITPALQDLRERARAVIDEDFAAAKLWAWKDPRTCLTLPFWQRLLPPMRYVICLRNPADVAYSLERRDGFSFEKSVHLWLFHVVSSLQHTAGHPRLLLFYEDFMAQWPQELRRLARYLGACARAEEEDTQKAVREFLKAELQRHHTSLAHTADHPGLPYPAKALYMILRLAATHRPEEISGRANAAPLFEEALNGFARDSIRAPSELELVRSRIVEKDELIAEKDKLIAELSFWLLAVQRTIGWKMLERLRRVRDNLLPPGSRRRNSYWVFRRVIEVLLDEGPRACLRKTGYKIRRALRGQGISVRVSPQDIMEDPNAQYQVWLQQHVLTPEKIAAMKTEVESFTYIPIISILTPVYNIDETWLRKALDSVRTQIYPHWELFLVNDASTKPMVRQVLDAYAGLDPRIRVKHLARNEGIVSASNHALGLATGEFVGLMDHDDELSPDALFEVVKRLNDDPKLDLLYSDEDKLELSGRRVEPFFKPDWSPDLLLSMNYITHFSVFRRSVLQEIGGFRTGFDGSQDYDLILRCTERTQRIAHIPKVLYHWRKVSGSAAGSTTAKSFAYEAGRIALEDALKRRGYEGRVERTLPGLYAVRCRLKASPLVSIIVPTKDRGLLLQQCLRSVEERNSYAPYEIVVVDNGSTEPEALKYLESVARKWRVFRYPGQFNFSAINNFGAAQAKGEYLVFLNNDTQVIQADWITAMLEHAQRPNVGAVGAKLLYPDGRIQHAGVVLGIGGLADHAFKYLPGSTPSYFGLTDVVRNCSAVTGACMMVSRMVFEEVRGFDERFRVAFNDIDCCLRLLQRGYLIVYTPLALLYHHESASRGRVYPQEDEELMWKRWGDVIRAGDPYYNPNLTLSREDWGLRL